MNRLIGMGAGGHAKVMIEILQLRKDFNLVGLLDPKKELQNTEVLGIPVLGDDHLLPTLYAQGIHHVFIGVGSVGDALPRTRLYQKARQHGFQIINIIHPQSIISPSAKIGDGPTIMANAVVNASTELGDNVIINTGAIVEHDCLIGNHVHIATGARLAGGVSIGEGSHIGLGASILQGVHIGRNVIVGAGAVVLHDVPDRAVTVGVPAKFLRKVIKE